MNKYTKMRERFKCIGVNMEFYDISVFSISHNRHAAVAEHLNESVVVYYRIAIQKCEGESYMQLERLWNEAVHYLYRLK